MKIGVPNEINEKENRVALIPEIAGELIRKGFEVLLETGAGEGASFSDGDYRNVGATIVEKPEQLYKETDLLVKVNPPVFREHIDKNEIEALREGAYILGFLAPLSHIDLIQRMQERQITGFSMEFVPRITRAQNMDALSSMATVAGYKAVLLAASGLDKFFPLLMTAAGTVLPANVLILGAGVAGLQAIATAKRLGARVEAFDPRMAVKEQVESLGAGFVEMDLPEDAETEGGYAKDLGDEFLLREQEAIASRLKNTDVVISTAQIFGKKAPILITKEMVKSMRSGSIIIDLAAEQGGNCELTSAGKTVIVNGVTIIGAVNLPASLPFHASQLYSKNISNLIQHIFGTESGKPDFEDEITSGVCVVRNGNITNDLILNALK